MNKIPAMVSMALDKEEQAEMMNPSPPMYPYGLCISLCDDEIEKLNLDTEDVSVGDMIHMHSLAKITSISQRDDENNGPCCRIELQIIAISAENEEDEDAEAESEMKRTSKLYI